MADDIKLPPLPASWRGAAHSMQGYARAAVLADRERRADAKDAARYRWIRDAEDRDWNRLLRDGGEAMDDAIDAAMAQRTPGVSVVDHQTLPPDPPMPEGDPR